MIFKIIQIVDRYPQTHLGESLALLLARIKNSRGFYPSFPFTLVHAQSLDLQHKRATIGYIVTKTGSEITGLSWLPEINLWKRTTKYHTFKFSDKNLKSYKILIRVLRLYETHP